MEYRSPTRLSSSVAARLGKQLTRGAWNSVAARAAIAPCRRGFARRLARAWMRSGSVTRMAWAQAHELRPHQCTALALSPGWLRSEQMLENYGVSEANWRDATARQPHFVITETPRYVGRAVAALAADPAVARWSGQSLSSGQLAKVYGFTDLDGSQPDAWRYVREVQDAGKPADATGYR